MKDKHALMDLFNHVVAGRANPQAIDALIDYLLRQKTIFRQVNLTKPEKSLLLSLESCAVDKAGLVDPRKLNTDDIETAYQWKEEGFLDFDWMPYEEGREFRYYVKLTPEAWAVATGLRFQRGERGRKKLEARLEASK